MRMGCIIDRPSRLCEGDTTVWERIVTEFTTASDGVPLAFERVGEGPPVVLVHGFGSSRRQNWKSTGWYGSLAEAGFSPLAMDCRGHGESGKPHELSFYGHDRMSEDIAQVMDAAGVETAPVVGYSMGGFLALRLAARHPGRADRIALGGVGEYYLRGQRIADVASRISLADALLAPDKSSLTGRARMFREFADQPGKDRLALAACMRAMSQGLAPDIMATIAQPVLVVCGELDDIAGSPGPLAAAFPQGEAVTIAGRDHMSAVGERKTRQAVTDFLRETAG
jgi:pimeloyl-ACP methyl ester carboxylesterase